MRATIMYGAKDVRIENRASPYLEPMLGTHARSATVRILARF